MADFRLGRLKFNWRGDWQASTAYVIDDIAKFGANTYVCTTNHTSVSDETTWYASAITTNGLFIPKDRLIVALGLVEFATKLTM